MRVVINLLSPYSLTTKQVNDLERVVRPNYVCLDMQGYYNMGADKFYDILQLEQRANDFYNDDDCLVYNSTVPESYTILNNECHYSDDFCYVSVLNSYVQLNEKQIIVLLMRLERDGNKLVQDFYNELGVNSEPTRVVGSLGGMPIYEEADYSVKNSYRNVLHNNYKSIPHDLIEINHHYKNLGIHQKFQHMQTTGILDLSNITGLYGILVNLK